jgi:hypothetical protein
MIFCIQLNGVDAVRSGARDVHFQGLRSIFSLTLGCHVSLRLGGGDGGLAGVNIGEEFFGVSVLLRASIH